MSNTPVGEITDLLVLAAIERAERHREGREQDPPGVQVWAALDHLALARRSRRARRVRGRLAALVAEGSLACSRRNGMVVWALTGRGRGCLARERRAGALALLPEAPQHVAWREAYAAADAQLDGFVVAVGEALVKAFFMLDGAREGSVGSDDWFELAERLHRLCRRLGSACHCLYEWEEPDDELADIDTREDPRDARLPRVERARRRARRAGRRNINLWQDG